MEKTKEIWLHYFRTQLIHQKGEFENAVSKAVNGGEVVKYEEKPIYKGINVVPLGVTLKATGDKGLIYLLLF